MKIKMTDGSILGIELHEYNETEIGVRITRNGNVVEGGHIGYFSTSQSGVGKICFRRSPGVNRNFVEYQPGTESIRFY